MIVSNPIKAQTDQNYHGPYVTNSKEIMKYENHISSKRKFYELCKYLLKI